MNKEIEDMYLDCDKNDLRILGLGTKEHEEAYMKAFDLACDNASLSIKPHGIEHTLKQRGEVYGEFSDNLECVSKIVDAMKKCRDNKFSYRSDVESKLDAEWHYLAIKLARIAASPEHIDSYHDLAGYATLMEKERIKDEQST